MKVKTYDYRQVISALLLALSVLFCSTFLAQQVKKSSFYRQSQLFSSIFSQDSVGLLEMVTEERNIHMLTQFVGAVTSAYINFELIPVNEAKTFTIIFESLNADISVDKFVYQRKDLMIYGNAATTESYEQFLAQLRKREYFSSVTGHTYTATDDTVRFQIFCTSAANSEALLAFALL